MITATYLDTLSSGMRARLDPTSRLSPRRRLFDVIGIAHHGVASLERRSPLSSVTRRNPFNDLKIRVTEY